MINMFVVTPKEDTIIGGRYRVSKGTSVQTLIRGLHHDPKVWGDDTDVFKPERFLNGGYEALPPNSFKAFGNGVRACIGRGSAKQEMLMATALISSASNLKWLIRAIILVRVSHYPEVDFTHPFTELKSTLTVKPDGLHMKVRRRPGKTLMVGIPGATSSSEPSEKTLENKTDEGGASVTGSKPPLLSLYGSNAGTCKSMAEDLETSAGNHFAVTIRTMDPATEHLP
jgi:cytochrome P450/NADPH-cytochrome P450 reductase